MAPPATPTGRPRPGSRRHQPVFPRHAPFHRALPFLLLLLPTPALALFNVFTQKAPFLQASGATNASGPIPTFNSPATNPVLGAVRISPAAGPSALSAGPANAFPQSPRLDGPLLAFRGREAFTATFAHPMHAAGFDMVEPRLDPRGEGPFVDSRFLVRLLLGNTEVGHFEFLPDDDTPAFCGVTSDRPFDRLVLTEVEGDAEDEYFGSFFSSGLPQSPVLPVSGIEVPAFASLSAALRGYLDASRYPGLQIAVLRNGRLVLDLALGWSDPTRSRALARHDPMPLASVSKILTDTAITRLLRTGHLQGTNTLVQLLGLQPPPGHQFGPHATIITIDHLLSHSAGLAEYRPDNARVGEELGLGRPASFAECLAWSLCQPLLFQPGTASAYSNFGYATLGVVVERISGLPYGEFLFQTLGQPLDMRSLGVPQESPVLPSAPATSLLAETYQNNAAAGGVRCSARDLCRFMRAFRGNGIPKPRPVPSGGFFFTFYGSADGALTVFNQRIASGTATEFAVLCNDRGYLNNDHLRNLVQSALDSVQSWPSHDLFPHFTWHMDHFWNPATASLPRGTLPDEDLDNDGISNFLEYALDLDPARPDATRPRTASFQASPGTFSFLAGRDPLKVDVRYQVLSSTDLHRWHAVARSVDGLPFLPLHAEAALAEIPQPGTSRVLLRLDWPSSSLPGPGFFHLRIDRQEATPSAAGLSAE